MTRDEATDLVNGLIDAERDLEHHRNRRSYVFDRDQIKEQIINALITKKSPSASTAVLDKPTVVKGSDLKVGDMIDVWWHPNRDIITKLTPYKGPLAHIFSEGAQLAEFFRLRIGMTIDNSDYYLVLERQV